VWKSECILLHIWNGNQQYANNVSEIRSVRTVSIPRTLHLIVSNMPGKSNMQLLQSGRYASRQNGVLRM